MSASLRNVLCRSLYRQFSCKLHNQARDAAQLFTLSANTTLIPNSHIRSLILTSTRFGSNDEQSAQEDEEKTEEIVHGRGRMVLDVDPETSIRYMNSKAYMSTYGQDPVWTKYRRNYKGSRPPPETRKMCIRAGKISTGNPCPLCRDDYLIVDYQNVKLLEQFISPFTGEVLASKKTSVCQKQQKNLLVAIEKAKDYGLIEEELPFREYDYSKYYPTTKTNVGSSSS